MNKFNTRINKLFIKTHCFISYNNNCLLKDYFQAQFDEIDKPEDFEEEFNEFSELKKNCDPIKNPEIEAQLLDTLRNNPAILYKLLFQDATEINEKYPNGIWLPKSVAEPLLKTLNRARRDFKSRKTAS